MRETRTDEKTDNLIYKLNAKCKIDKFKLNFPNKKNIYCISISGKSQVADLLIKSFRK